MLSLDAQLRRLEKKLDKIATIETARAYAAAVNKTAATVKTHVIKQVSVETKIAQKNLRNKIFIRRATANKQNVRMSFYTRPVNGIFAPFSKQSKGHKVAGKLVERSFFAAGRKGRHQIFQRKLGAKRLPIKVVTIPIQDAVNRHAIPIIKEKMATDFIKYLTHEFHARINKYVQSNN